MTGPSGASFAQSLASLPVADEYRLIIYPYLARTGKRLFTNSGKLRALDLVSRTSFANGVLALSYRQRR